MEMRNYLRLFRRWGWLMLLLTILGAAIGYVYSQYQTPIFRSSTRILIMQPTDGELTSPLVINDKQTSTTFTELIATGPILQATSERLGYQISRSQVFVTPVPQTDIIEITVEDEDPERAAQIANTLVTVFVEQNQAVQASRYAAAEESMQAQIRDFESRITELQAQLTQISEESYNQQVQNVTKTIGDLQGEINVLQDEIVQLDYIINPPASRIPGRFSTAPTPTVEQQMDFVKKQDRLNELRNLLAMYQTIYVDLTFSRGAPSAGEARRVDQVQAALDQYIQSYTNLLNNYEELRMVRMRSTSNIVQVESATPATRPVRPLSTVNGLLGGVVGMLLAGAFAFYKEYTDDTLRTPEEVYEVMRLPVLGYIGDMTSPRLKSPSGRSKMPYVLAAPRSPVTEAFRSLRANLEFTGKDLDRPVKTLLITSSTLSEGKTTVAVNLAIVMAQLGRRVILMDADLRRPRVHQALGMSNMAGLSDVLRKQASIADVAHSWGNGNLLVITSGSLPPNPAEILSSERMKEVLKELKDQADMVIIDSPPSLLADASVLAARSDGVLLVVQSNKTHLNAALGMTEQLNRVGARVIGVALNRMSNKDSFYYYGDLKNYNSYAYDIEKTQPTKKGS